MAKIVSNKMESLETFQSKLFYEHFKEIEFNDNYSIFSASFNNYFRNVLEKNLYKDKILKWLRIADDKIIQIIWTSKNQIEGFKILHNGVEKNYCTIWIIFRYSKWMDWGLYILKAFFIKQSFFFIDEIDNSLHPFLVNFIVAMFNDTKINKKGSQLFFTSHSPLSVEKPFRKDAINFIDEVGEIINLGDEKIREDLSIVKNFLSEKLCSHPYKSYMFEWLEEFYE